MANTPSQTNASKSDVPSGDIATHLSSQTRNKRIKVVRTALTLREKAVVKSFCEQKLTDCKARGQSVPSQEALRQEIVSQFGWSCGRSTLSKIIAMDWRFLRGSHEGGEAPRNSSMKRRRRPLFPAFEADLVKFILTHIVEEAGIKDLVGAATDVVSADTEHDREDRGQPLTEALILEEAQRLKRVHGVSDKMLVLSVGWLARFKHRHCIRLRKPARVANKDTMTGESVSVGIWNDELLPATKADIEPLTPRYQAVVGDNGEGLPLSSRPQLTRNLSNISTSAMNLATMALCSAQWVQVERIKGSSKTMALLDQLPKSIRGLGCTCHVYDDFIGAIGGLNVAVVGLGSVVDAFLLAQAVGADGFVTCLEASFSNAHLAEIVAESFCLRTLGLSTVNMKFIVGDFCNVNSQSVSPLQGNELKNLRGQVSFVLFNCSVQSLDFPASKNVLLKMAFSLLKNGGELRVTDLVCSRRLSLFETEEAYLAGRDSDVKEKATRMLWSSIRSQQKLLLGAPYIGDLQRLFRTLDCNVDLRIKSCSEADAEAINSSVVKLFPSFASAGIRFRRVTFRAFRLENVEEPWEDYGQFTVFSGCGAEEKDTESAFSSHSFRLDDTWNFQSGIRTPIDGNTAQILQATWMQRYFAVSGDRSRHHGRFVKEAQTL